MLYPPAQPQSDLGEPIWPDLGDEEEEMNYVVQLMMLHKHSFLKMQEEDYVIQKILTNECIVTRDIAESSILKLCTYEDCVYPASPEIISM